MYPIVLNIHSILAYVVFLLLMVSIIRWIVKINQNATYSDSDKKWSKIVVMVVHTQFLIGLVLYLFLSPITQEAFSNVGEAMRNSALRFMLLEHITANLLAVVAITMGSVKAKKVAGDKIKFKKLAFLFSIGFILLLSRVPWANWWNLN